MSEPQATSVKIRSHAIALLQVMLPAWLLAAEKCVRLLGNAEESAVLPRRFSLWNAAARKFEELEALTANDTVFCSVDQVSDVRGKTLIVVAEIMYPFVINEPGTKKLTGFIGDTWTVLAEVLKFKTVFRIHKDGSFLPGLTDGDTHAALAAVATYKAAGCYYAYSSPLTVNSYHLFVRSEGATVTNWMFFNTFCWDLWTIFLVSVFGIVCAILGIHHVKKRMDIAELDDEFASPVFIFLYVLSGVCGQGFWKVPESSSLRVIMMSCLMMGMIVVYTFNSNLTSYLANKKRYVPLANIEDVLAKRTHSLCMRNLSRAYAYFTVTGFVDSDIQDVWKGLVNTGNCPDMRDTETLASKLCRPRVVYLEGAHVFLPIYRQVEHICNIVQLPESYWDVILTFAHSRSSQYRELLNVYLLRMRSAGILKYFERKWKFHERLDQPQRSSSFHPVEYEHIAKGVLFFALMILLSVIICVLENIWYGITEQQYRRRNPESILLGPYRDSMRATKTMRRRLQPKLKWRRKLGPILLSAKNILVEQKRV